METPNQQLEPYNNIFGHHSAFSESATSLLKIKLGMIPGIGSVINELLFDLGARIQQNRVNEFVHHLGAKVQEIEQEKINYEFFKSEEFYDLTQKILESVNKAGNENKRRALANIYLSAMIARDLNFDEQMIFVDFVNSLRTAQMYILRFINTKHDYLVEIGTYEKYFAKFQESFPGKITDKYEFRYYNTDLETKSLITMEGGLDNFDSKSSIQAFEDHKDASVRLTALGEKFIKYLLK